MLCVLHLECEFVQNRQNVFKALRSLLGLEGSYLRHGLLQSSIQGYRRLKSSSMLTYLTNRHYHLLTKELPQEMRQDQPKVVYLPAHNSEKVDYQTNKKPQSKLKVKRSKQMVETSSFVGDCCPTCLSDNIPVEFYGKKHICVKCRKLIRDEFGNQIRIFVNEEGEIVCLGIKKSKNDDGEGQKMYYYTDYTSLNINGRSAFATFAAPDEMVVILRLPNQSLE